MKTQHSSRPSIVVVSLAQALMLGACATATHEETRHHPRSLKDHPAAEARPASRHAVARNSDLAEVRKVAVDRREIATLPAPTAVAASPAPAPVKAPAAGESEPPIQARSPSRPTEQAAAEPATGTPPARAPIPGSQPAAAAVGGLAPGLDTPPPVAPPVAREALPTTASRRGAAQKEAVAKWSPPQQLALANPETQSRTDKTVKAQRLPPIVPGSIAATIEQAELQLRLGNVVGARETLDPPAKAGSPEALVALARTYDPIELSGFMAAPGLEDADRALALYGEAVDRGSVVAKAKLERLRRTVPTGEAVDRKN